MENLQKTEIKEKLFLSDKIGESYKMWNPMDVIEISAPTGCGKSYFILHTLLPYAQKENKKILYLVNRKILKSQLEEELRDISFNINGIENFITFETYQNIENKICKGIGDPLYLRESDGEYSNHFEYIVYDECHYFYADSDFNTRTIESFRYVINNAWCSTHIFMSATMKNIQPFIHNELGKSIAPGFHRKVFKDSIVVPVDYSYVRLHGIEVDENIPQIIQEKKKGTIKTKWLIFNDNIKKGKNILEELADNGTYNKEDMVFINADYESDENAKESVEELDERKLISKDIIMCTSVLDNGVSFKDVELRNILIMTDLEESFIQMLGRKRKDNGIVDVYICKRNENYFRKRLSLLEKKIRCYSNYQKTITQMNEHLTVFNNIDELTKINDKKYGISFKGMWYALRDFRIIMDKCILKQQQLLNDILSRECVRENVRCFCYVKNGRLNINEISIAKMRNMKAFYENLIAEFETDENAFFKQQARWLNISENQIERVVLKSDEQINERKRERLLEILEGILEGQLERKLSPDENKEYFKRNKETKSLLRYFFEKINEMEDKVKRNRYMKQNERAVRSWDFNCCMKEANIDFKMEEVKGKYIISHKGKDESWDIRYRGEE